MVRKVLKMLGCRLKSEIEAIQMMSLKFQYELGLLAGGFK